MTSPDPPPRDATPLVELRHVTCGYGTRVVLEDISLAVPRGNVLADTRAYRTSVDKVFSAGDMRRGQSLIVWAIREGRQAARAIDEHLMGASVLPA